MRIVHFFEITVLPQQLGRLLNKGKIYFAMNDPKYSPMADTLFGRIGMLIFLNAKDELPSRSHYL